MPQRPRSYPERFDRVWSLALALNDGDLFRREVVEFIDQIVDLAVESGALVFVEVLVSFRLSSSKLLLCFEHLHYELHHPVVSRAVRIVRKIEYGDWQPLNVLLVCGKITPAKVR